MVALRAANAPGTAIEPNSATCPSVITPAISWRSWNTGTMPDEAQVQRDRPAEQADRDDVAPRDRAPRAASASDWSGAAATAFGVMRGPA